MVMDKDGANAPLSAAIVPKAILVVDDEHDIREVVVELLDTAGYTAVATESALTAYALLNNAHFDLVLTDVMMPEMNGFGLKKLIQSHPRLRHLPVVFMSGYSNQLVQTHEPYLGKPFEFNDLLATIELALMTNTSQRAPDVDTA